MYQIVQCYLVFLCLFIMHNPLTGFDIRPSILEIYSESNGLFYKE